MFIGVMTPPAIEEKLEVETPYIFDMKLGDVTGDQIDDFVYLAGSKQSPDAIYQENLTLYIVDGITNETTMQVLPLKGGYGGMLFVGDFNQDFIEDVYVSVSSGGSGNLNYYYVYSFKEKEAIQLFDYEVFNQMNQWQATFKDQYKIELSNQNNQVFMLDISKKDVQLLSKYYNPNGSVKSNILGEVLSIGGLTPVVTPIGNGSYDLVASQRIVGITPIDDFGVIETYLTFKGQYSYPYEIVVGERQNLK